ncbi:SAM-dependent methyltransferase [Rhodopirellula sp. MGV]|uniref:SAM-dependent methyltransferase n=1 Tax=Rhodopirellula sp. MGV TaxID=2023130 RepID=UPI000B96FA9A|nr:SAM-dependent methyltransferase [Rhodopirellula sp. MGV]OYP30465.1 SAM-dependent methyltransferase [Rhodopirellula sp. MGV]PNY33550.1 SAM-dependent methyltransferase [Rhodopirellula baltica]
MTNDSVDAEQPSFAMVCCANGAEKRVLHDIEPQGWRRAFSRPGFVTLKNDSQSKLPHGTFVRSAAYSLGHLRNVDGQAQVQSLIELLQSQYPSGIQFDELHVWPRDRLPIGKFGFEPGQDEVSQVVAQEIFNGLGDTWLRCDAPNRIAEPDARCLDVVLVDPSDWFIGQHTASDWHTRWPGGVQPINPQYEPISRAYYKAAESIAWSGFDIAPGDLAVEVGSAPGGACGRMLELGMRVIGIDPAEMDPRIAEHPRFKHLRARAGDLPRKEFRGVKWLLADSNVKPEKTLVTIENIVKHSVCEIEGLLLTMKLGDYEVADRIPQWLKRIKSWNPVDVRVRQLARNRCEVCLAIRLKAAK